MTSVTAGRRTRAFGLYEPQGLHTLDLYVICYISCLFPFAIFNSFLIEVLHWSILAYVCVCVRASMDNE